MVFLFGWMSNFVLFSRITENLYVFLIVLNEVIVQDILLSFILVFVCTVVGFSFSLHALRLKSETSEDVLLRRTGMSYVTNRLVALRAAELRRLKIDPVVIDEKSIVFRLFC